ncbi:MAG: NADH-quinone oxidoreductase subunit M, partial [Gammaproteobacteria bacterium]|nr:NADH-quinone oxidoreductase subunit M [Gammaproteobacteria bacterium]
MIDYPLLSLLVWLPIAGGAALLAMDAMGNSGCRVMALLVSLATFVLSLSLYTNFDFTTAAMQFQENVPWIEAISANYHLGVDGISMPLIILTTFTTVLVVLAGWEVIQDKAAQYMAAFLVM